MIAVLSRAKVAAEGSGIGSSLGIEVGEVAVDQAAAQLPFEIAGSSSSGAS